MELACCLKLGIESKILRATMVFVLFMFIMSGLSIKLLLLLMLLFMLVRRSTMVSLSHGCVMRLSMHSPAVH